MFHCTGFTNACYFFLTSTEKVENLYWQHTYFLDSTNFGSPAFGVVLSYALCAHCSFDDRTGLYFGISRLGVDIIHFLWQYFGGKGFRLVYYLYVMMVITYLIDTGEC